MTAPAEHHRACAHCGRPWLDVTDGTPDAACPYCGAAPRPPVTGEAVAAVLRACRFAHADERELQEAAADALATAFGRPVELEVPLGDLGRLDILIDGVAVEVKVAGTLLAATRQMDRYAEHPDVRELVLLTTRVPHAHRAQWDAAGGHLGGKPFHVAAVFPAFA